MKGPSSVPRLHDVAPDRRLFLAEVLEGLRRAKKSIPCKYFYDAAGSALFERICRLEEYYPTRTELKILRDHVGDMAAAVGPRCLLVEYGTGSGRKTRLLLDALEEPSAYVPIDISKETLARSAAALAAEHPGLEVLPVCADYTQEIEIPRPSRPADRRAVFFPGSTIGNFTREEALGFMRRVRALVGPGGGFLVGVDLRKDPKILEAAYDDREGVTAAFNLNLLARINRELGADFRLDRFRHLAFWNEAESRIEMHLVSTVAQAVRIGGAVIAFGPGETIHTENSYKYEILGFAALAARAGLRLERVWTDAGRKFGVLWLAAGARGS